MASVITPNLEIPDDLLPAIESGKLLRIGGVIVDSATKQVVKWLKEVPISEEVPPSLVAENAAVTASKSSIGSRMLSAISKHKGFAAGVAIVSLVAVCNTIYYVVEKNKENERMEHVPDYVSLFNKWFKKYLAEAQAGSLNEETIKKLDACIEKMENEARNQHITIDLSGDDYHRLMMCIKQYTENLLKQHHVDVSIAYQPSINNLALLRNCLKAQRTVLEDA